MIHDLQVARDQAGFPIVAWAERRNIASPEATKLARVECRIMKDRETGVLLFVARGTVRHGLFEEARHWEKLNSFSIKAADELYYSRKELEFRRHMAGKSAGAKLALTDSAYVLLAEFRDETGLHINCADTSPVDIERLHVALVREFILRRDEIVGEACHGYYEWPIDDERLPAFAPARLSLAAGRTKLALEALGWIMALGIVVTLGLTFLWVSGVFSRH